MNAFLLREPAWSNSAPGGGKKELFDISDEYHASESSLWWESMESLAFEEEVISEPGSKTDPMIQISTPATYNCYFNSLGVKCLET